MDYVFMKLFWYVVGAFALGLFVGWFSCRRRGAPWRCRPANAATIELMPRGWADLRHPRGEEHRASARSC